MGNEFKQTDLIVIGFFMCLMFVSWSVFMYGLIYFSFECECTKSCVDYRYGDNFSDSHMMRGDEAYDLFYPNGSQLTLVYEFDNQQPVELTGFMKREVVYGGAVPVEHIDRPIYEEGYSDAF